MTSYQRLRDVLERRLIRCDCGFSWFSADVGAAGRALEVHRETCSWMKISETAGGGAGPSEPRVTVSQIYVYAPDPDHHCRENEPPQNPPPSRADRDGLCSWNCRGSYSWNCFCPCRGERHGENHRWDPDERVARTELDGLYGQIEGALPRGDWPGRKST